MRSLKVLVVDDDSSLRKMYSLIAGLYHCKITEADNGEKAIALLQKNEYDLVITDYQMPSAGKNDGIAVVKACKGLHPNTKVFFSTGYAGDNFDEFKNMVLDAGAHYFFSKPLQSHSLRQVIEEVILEKCKMPQEALLN